MEVVGRVSLGAKQGLSLVRVGGRVLILGVGEAQTTLVGELEGDDLEAALRPSRESRAEVPHQFQQLLTRLPGMARVITTTILFVALSSFGAEASVAQEVAGDSAAPAAEQLIPEFDLNVGGAGSGLNISGPVGIVIMMGVMTVLPAIILMMTSFTRILIVLHFLRSAIGTQTSPPGQLLTALALIMSSVVMGPVLTEANSTALQPYLNGQIEQADAYAAAIVPFREFMLRNTGESELALFVDITRSDAQTLEELPTSTLVSAFVTSELKVAFQMGFVLFLPFIVIDLIVASVLMSMGMFMLPPVMVSLPFKLLLFVLADGWSLMIKNLVTSFA